MKKTIDFNIKGKDYNMPNCWELLSPSMFINLAALLRLYSAGSISVNDVRLGYVTHFLDIDLKTVTPKYADAVAANLYILLSQVDFIFNIHYAPDVWNGLSAQTRKQALKCEPFDLPDTPEVRYLRKQNYSFVLDASFASQLVPVVNVNGIDYEGYRINTDCGELSCSLTARQYIDASERLFRIIDNPDLLPLLAAILYCPGTYNSTWAHNHAKSFASLSAETLEAIALNFQSFVIFLFEKTDYSILRRRNGKEPKGIFVGMSEGLYNLSTDGYGDLDTVSNFSVIDYLDILRKKLIETVCTMHASDIKLSDIVSKTGLDLNIINQILA